MTDISSTISSILKNYLQSSSSTVSTSSSTSSTSAKTSSDTASSEKTAESNTALKRYFDSTSEENLDSKKIFDKLSIDVGGDTGSITKKELDSYIGKAEDGSVKLSDNELSGLKTLSNNWSAISDGAQSINYYSVSASGYKDTLFSMAPDSTDSVATSSTSDLKKLTADATANAYSKIVVSALGGSTSSSSSTSTFASMLSSLLKGTTDENDDGNAEAIAALTNLMAGSNSTVEKKA